MAVWVLFKFGIRRRVCGACSTDIVPGRLIKSSRYGQMRSHDRRLGAEWAGTPHSIPNEADQRNAWASPFARKDQPGMYPWDVSCADLGS